MIRVEDETQVGMARRAARDAATVAGLDQERIGRAALVATEAATNLARHAQRGVIFVRPLEPMEGRGIEILAIDRGPGMADLAAMMQDGHSTRGGGAGQGLGAIHRMADEVLIETRSGEGTVLMARVREGPAPTSRFVLGAMTAGVTEDGCGDALGLEILSHGARVLVADGLGHGPDAEYAAQAALAVFRKTPGQELNRLFQDMDAACRPTRGAAVAVADIDLPRRLLRFAGVGNISAVLLQDDKPRSLVSVNGIVGHTMRRVQTFDYPLGSELTLIMHTDGLGSRWDARKLPPRSLRHPALLAAELWRSEARGRDDIGVAVLRGRT